MFPSLGIYIERRTGNFYKSNKPIDRERSRNFSKFHGHFAENDVIGHFTENGVGRGSVLGNFGFKGWCQAGEKTYSMSIICSILGVNKVVFKV